MVAHQNKQRRIEMILAITVFALLMATNGSAEPCQPQCEIQIVEAHPHEALQVQAQAFGITIKSAGETLPPITVNLREPSVDRLVRKLADLGGYLIQQRGAEYTFYGTNIDEVTISVSPKHITVGDAAVQLRKFEMLDVTVLQAANVLVLRGPSEEVRRGYDFLEIIDYERPNVFLELLVVEYFHGDAFTWSFDIVNGVKGKLSDLTFAPGAGAAQGLYNVIADLDKSFRLNLTALVSDSEARVVTNPHVAVRSGAVGQIDFKEELNIVLTNATESFGVTKKLHRLEAGVSLSVTPQVLSTGYVDLKVNGSLGVFVPASQGQYAIDRQTVQTEVLLESGKTLVIAGLVAKQISLTKSGVPGLRKIPLLGRLFGAESRNVQFVETVIYITPYVDKPSFFQPENIGRDVEEHFDRLGK